MPKYSRNHEIDASVISAVTGGGRLFYVVDEGPAGTMGQHLPQKWALIARDAFSGVILWKRPVPNMGWPAWKPSLADDDWLRNKSSIPLMRIAIAARGGLSLMETGFIPRWATTHPWWRWTQPPARPSKPGTRWPVWMKSSFKALDSCGQPPQEPSKLG